MRISDWSSDVCSSDLVLALLGLTLLGTAPLSALAAEQGEGEGAAAKGGEKPEKKRKKQGEGEPIPEPPINSPQLIVEAVTAPVLPSGTIIMTLTVDCGTVENARAVNAMMPRVDRKSTRLNSSH